MLIFKQWSVQYQILARHFLVALAVYISAGCSVDISAAELPPISLMIEQPRLDELRSYSATLELDEILARKDYGVDRESAEILLLHRALSLGGCAGPYQYQPLETRDYQRGSMLMEKANASVSATAWWPYDKDISDRNLRQSSALSHSFEVGLYSSQSRAAEISINQFEDFSSLTAVVGQLWIDDINLLKSLQLHHIYYQNHWPSMVKMIRGGRADFMLAPFQSRKDMVLLRDGIQLYPVEGIKLDMPRQRRWLFSLNDAAGERAWQCVEGGIQQLKQSGEIERAYRLSGVIHPDVKDWTLFSPLAPSQ